MMLRYFTIIATLLLLTACPKGDAPDATLILRNNTMDKVILHRSRITNFTDTLLPESSWFPTQGTIDLRSIQPESSEEIPDQWGRVMEANTGKVLMVFFFDRDTILHYSWEEVRADYKVLRRYDLSLSDLEAMDWTVEYP